MKRKRNQKKKRRRLLVDRQNRRIGEFVYSINMLELYSYTVIEKKDKYR